MLHIPGSLIVRIEALAHNWHCSNVNGSRLLHQTSHVAISLLIKFESLHFVILKSRCQTWTVKLRFSLKFFDKMHSSCSPHLLFDAVVVCHEVANFFIIRLYMW